MAYRVCIPCAGTGSRLGQLTQFLNKSLVSISNRPILSHIIEKFPDDTEFVISLGHKGYLVRDFAELAYPERKFYFAEVTPFEGPGSGLGLSLLACKDYLQQPFIFTSCDTLVKESIPGPEVNWMGFSKVTNIAPYRTIKLEGDLVIEIAEKGVGNPDTHRPYIGLAGIHDYAKFWHAMEQGGMKAIESGEVFGLCHIGDSVLKAYAFTWHDAGNPDALKITKESYRKPDEPNILDKVNESIWFIGNQVIKYSDDQNFIANRVKRASLLMGFVPQITGSGPNMFRYSKVEGSVLSDVVTLPLFDKLLQHCESFWTPTKLNDQAQACFIASCKKFYRDKTFERVKLFYTTFDKTDGTQPINGIAMPTLQSLLEGLDWDWLSDGISGRFHGDFHFENILWSEISEQFIFLDWRQDFAGDLAVGDVYYDLAKLLHGLIVNHGLIAKDRYTVTWTTNQIHYDLDRRQILVECERQIGAWLEKTRYDKRKVWTLTALIYLNIAALHHYPYCLLLYALGKSMLKSEMEQ